MSEAEIYDDYSIPPLHQSLEDIEREFKKGLFLKVEDAGVIIGSVRAYEEADVCHIGKLIVRVAWQNQGLGGRLLREIEARYAHVKAYELFTGAGSVKNLHIYQIHGYTEQCREKVSLTLTLVFFTKLNTVRHD